MRGHAYPVAGEAGSEDERAADDEVDAGISHGSR